MCVRWKRTDSVGIFSVYCTFNFIPYILSIHKYSFVVDIPDYAHQNPFEALAHFAYLVIAHTFILHIISLILFSFWCKKKEVSVPLSQRVRIARNRKADLDGIVGT